MTDELREAHAYLAPRPTFWRWADDGSAAWLSGRTIAFRQELAAVVQRLAPQGLPPLSAILLLLAATRDGWAAASSELLTHVQETTDDQIGNFSTAAGVALRAVGHRLASDAAKLVERLNGVAALPGDLRHPLAAKAELAAMMFESAARSPISLAAEALAQLRSDLSLSDISVTAGSNAVRELVEAIDAFSRAPLEIDEQSIRLRLRTGLDGTIKPTGKELGPSQRVRQLLAELTDDSSLGGIARLSRDLLAALQLPRRLKLKQELPIGGVADMSNRGSLDRLLVSELANDDLMFTVRLAMGEALYLQRESPPHEPPHGRRLLIDTGIRMWGMPRLFASAVAMALAASADDAASLIAFRADGDELTPVDLQTRDGLLSHLEALDAHPHPGRVLPKLADGSNDESSELFIITHEDAFEDADFRAALAESGARVSYAATVNATGNFRLWAITDTGRKLIRQATLNLKQLVEQPPQKKFVLAELSADEIGLPLILSARPLPLRLPPMQPPRACVRDAGTGLLEVTLSKQLLHWKERNKGPVLLADRLPPGELKLLGATASGKFAVVIIRKTNRTGARRLHRALVDLATQQVVLDELLDHPSAKVTLVLRGDDLYAISAAKASVYALTNPRPLGTINLQDHLHVGGRLFREGWTHKVLAYDGTSLALVAAFSKPVPPGDLVLESPLWNGVQHFERLDLLPSKLGSKAPLPGVMMYYRGISPDGRRIFASGRDLTQYELTSIADGWQRRDTKVATADFLSGRDLRTWSMPPLRNKVRALAVDPQGRLLLLAGESKVLAVNLASMTLDPVLAWPLPAFVPLNLLQLQRHRTYSLKVAEWKNGSKAYLDSRGMMHLKSDDVSIPQITLVLNDAKLAAWTSGGHFFGNEYFYTEKRQASDLEKLLLRFTQRLK